MHLLGVLLAAATTLPGPAALRDGDYLNVAYMVRIQEARSPLAADSAGHMLLYRVARKADDAELLGVHNFHEGGVILRLQPGGVVRVIEPSGAVAPVVNVTGPGAFSVRWPKNRTATLPASHEDGDYAWVGNAESWVARQILVGTYRTASGFTMTFQPDGTVVLPMEVGLCTIGLDHVLTRFDYLFGPHCNYGFKFSDGQLSLFETYETADGFDRQRHQPKWVLRRTK
jgi:hypothetical protein